jgi:hypothetical protein
MAGPGQPRRIVRKRWLYSSSQRTCDTQLVFNPPHPIGLLDERAECGVLVARSDKAPTLHDAVVHSES